MAADPEFMLLVSGIDETFVSTVHARTSNGRPEIRWGARFADIYMRRDDEEDLSIDVRRLSEFLLAPLSVPATTA